MKKILFIPTYTYLSSPIFSNLLEKLNEYENIYLDVEEQFDSEKTSREFKDKFTQVIKIESIGDKKSFFSKIINIFEIIKFKNELICFLKKEKPSIIITTSDLSLSVRVIKKYLPYTPIVVIQSAMISNIGLNRTFKHYLKYIIFNKVLSLPIIRKQNYFGHEYNNNILLLWGDYFKKLVDNNNTIKSIGDITFDNFPIKKSLELKKELLLKYNFKEETKIITICTSAFSGIIDSNVEKKLYDIYKNIIIIKKELFFIIKPHPRNNGKELEDIFTPLKADNFIILNNHLHTLFQYTDIHISSFSRTALEALASNIPILSINPDNEIKLEDFFNNEIDEKVRSIDEMIIKIDALLDSTDKFFDLRDIYIDKMLYRLDGGATQRAVDIIKEEIEKNG